MLATRASRLLLAGALTLVAGTAVAVTGVAGATASTSTLPRLDAPGLHVQAGADPAPTAAASCGYHATIPADRFKGIPVFNAAQAAQPFIVRFFTTQGVITVRMLTAQAPCTTYSFRFLASRGYYNQENLAGATYPAGTVAMANAGPNTNGSQFFFTWKNTTLAPDYTPFGTVIGGLNVLQKIAAAGDDQQNGPGDGYPTLYTAFQFVQIIPQL
jgi:peptidyl-prolyl cis-trans isomerase B (cyclophilin B)